MTGTFVVAVLGTAVVTGATLGMSIGWLLDKNGTKPGRHRRSNSVVRSMLPLLLPWLFVIAATLPTGNVTQRTMHETTGQEIGAEIGATSWVG